MVISKAEAQAYLGPDERDLIRGWVLGGVADYFGDLYTPEARLLHRTSTRASCIHDHILGRVARGFQDVSGSRMFAKRGLHLLAVRDAMVCRFKKLDSQKRPRSIQTQQTINFMKQLPYFGVATATNVIVGYELNPAATACKSVSIVCPGEDRNEWEWELLDTNLLAITPPTIADTQPGVKVSRARLKGGVLEVMSDDARDG